MVSDKDGLKRRSKRDTERLIEETKSAIENTRQFLRGLGDSSSRPYLESLEAELQLRLRMLQASKDH